MQLVYILMMTIDYLAICYLFYFHKQNIDHFPLHFIYKASIMHSKSLKQFRALLFDKLWIVIWLTIRNNQE
jgi:hypothetical protein